MKEETKGETFSVDYHNIKKAGLVIRALNNKLRQQIISLINEHKRLTVTDIYVKLRLEQSVASQHLGILRKASVVKAERDGKFIFYSISYPRIQNIEKVAIELIG